MSPTVTGGLEGVGTEEAVRRESGSGGTVGLEEIELRRRYESREDNRRSCCDERRELRWARRSKSNRRSCCDGDREVRSGAGDDSEADPDRGFGDRGLEGDRAPARSEMVTGSTGGLEGADRGHLEQIEPRSRLRWTPAALVGQIGAEMVTGEAW